MRLILFQKETKNFEKENLQRNDVVLTTHGTVGNAALYDALRWRLMMSE